jgi:hypothetical protein
MDPQRVRELAQRGGLKAAELHRAGLINGHRFNSETARAAARKMQADRKAAKTVA